MLDKIIDYGTAVGITLSFTGFILMNIFSMSDEFNSVYDKIYSLTLIFSVLFILTISEFINQKFNKILKIAGIIFSIILIENIIAELNIYELNNAGMINLILSSSLYFMYLNFFWRKHDKTKLSYLKVIFLTLLFMKGFLKEMEFRLTVFENVIHFIFWIIIVVELIRKNANSNMKYVE